MTPYETLKIVFTNYLYSHPYFASFAKFELGLGQLPGVPDWHFCLCLPWRLLAAVLVVCWWLENPVLLLYLLEGSAEQVYD